MIHGISLTCRSRTTVSAWVGGYVIHGIPLTCRSRTTAPTVDSSEPNFVT